MFKSGAKGFLLFYTVLPGIKYNYVKNSNFENGKILNLKKNQFFNPMLSLGQGRFQGGGGSPLPPPE